MARELAIARRTLALAASLVVGWVLPASAQLTPGVLELAPCELPLYEGEAYCGFLSLPEDPDAAGGRRIDIHVAVLAALEPDPLPDPLFVFNGGPGQAASEAAYWAAEDFAPVRRRRDIVLVDRRGTGQSNPLDCPELPPEAPPQRFLDPIGPARIRQCRELLEERADLTLYTTPFAVEDVERVREAMGYERINLFGPSYGSREALVYLRRHPERVRSVILQAVIPPQRRAALEAARTAEQALQRLFDDCTSDEACRGAYPDLRAEFAAVMARLAEGPVRFRPGGPPATERGAPEATDEPGDPVPGEPVSVEGPGDAERPELELPAEAVLGTLRMLLVSPGRGSLLPAYVHAAHAGDFAPLGEQAILARRLMPTAISRGLFLSVTCAEELGRVQEEEILPATRGTFWGDAWVRSLQRQCSEWPGGRLPGDYFAPPGGDAPVLILQGWLDPISPPAWGRELLRHLPNSRLVVVRNGHHNWDQQGCGATLMAEFIDRLDAHGLDASCVDSIPRPPFQVDLP